MWNKTLSEFAKNIISFFFFMIMCWLSIMSLFTVCHINSSEHTYFVGSTYAEVFIKIVVFGVISFAYYFLKKRYGKKIPEKYETVIEYLLLGLIFATSLIWVLTVKSSAVSDQREVMKAAAGLLEGDYSSFETGGYISYYTVQMGLVIVHYFMAIVFGTYNYLAFQIASAAAVMFTWKQLYDISKYIGTDIFDRIVLLIMGVLFLPYTFYSSFVYGTVIGFMFAIAAVKYELLFIRTLKWKDAMLGAAFIAISVLVKTNYVIFLVGMLATVLVWMIANNNRNTYLRGTVAVVLLIVLYLAQSVGTRQFIERKTGQQMDKSMASIAWLEMGLQEGDRAPGWYNEYNYKSYLEADCNPSVQKERVKGDLNNTLNEMKAHKGDTLRFFTRKTASQWLNPSFQSLWIMQQTVSMKKGKSELMDELISSRGNILYESVYSVFEFVFLMGCLIYCLLKISGRFFLDKRLTVQEEKVKNGLVEFTLEIIFFGGFLFYLFWEAKCQYTIIYMVMISVLSVKGLSSLCEVIGKAIDGQRETVSTNEGTTKIQIINTFASNVEIKTLLMMALVYIVIVLCSIVNTHFREMIRLNYDADSYNAYKAFFCEDDEYEPFPMDNVKILPVSNRDRCLANDGEVLWMVSKEDGCNAEGRELKRAVNVKNYGKTQKIVFSGKRDLKAYLNGENGYNIEAGEKGRTDEEFWKISQSSDGDGYLICLYNGYALTYNEENDCVYMSEISNSKNQRWLFEQ